MKRSMLLLAMVALLPLACSPSPPATPLAEAGTALPTAVAGPDLTATAPAHPVATTGPAPALSFGEPRWLGRGRIVDACFSPDARLLAVGWGSGVSLWSAETGAERWWRPTEACVIAIDLHPGGGAVAALLEDGRVALFDAATGRARLLEGAHPHVYWGDVAWSPDGTRIALQCIGPNRGDPIYLLEAGSGARHEVPGSTISSVTAPYLAWSPDGEAITLARLDACSTIIGAATGQVQLTLGSGDACYSAYGLAWSPDGRATAALSTDPAGRLDLLDARTGRVLRTLEGGARGLSGPGAGRSLVFSPDGRFLASRGGQAPHPVGWTPLVVWDVETGQLAAKLQGDRKREDRVAVAFDGSDLVSLYATGEICRWPIGAGEVDETTIARLPVLAPEPPLAWSADNERIAAAGRGGVTVWDAASAAMLASFGPGHSVPALSADGRLLAVTDEDRHEEVIYDLEAGKVIRTLPDAAPILQGAAFSPDGQLIAYGAGNRLIIAEVASGRLLAGLEGYPEGQVIARVAWAPDGSALVAASSEPLTSTPGPVILWERAHDGSFREAFRAQHLLAGYAPKPVGLFSPDGALVAFEDLPRPEAGLVSVSVLDRRASSVILTLKDHVLAAWVSDEVLLTAEEQLDTRLTQWNVRSGARTVGKGRDLGGNAYAPGGRCYATASLPPYAMRGIDLREWETGGVLCSAHHGAD
ncbi:MAG: WD40 repeat domain-containing protein, partial [Anaerolineae bacterium]|nr:WD40 repeat domain-containing protein [Anaerolineae bacterium]